MRQIALIPLTLAMFMSILSMFASEDVPRAIWYLGIAIVVALNEIWWMVEKIMEKK